MALFGENYGPWGGTNNHYRLQILAEVISQDVANNTSTIRSRVWLHNVTASYFTGQSSLHVQTIDGVYVYNGYVTRSVPPPPNAGTLVMDNTRVVTHAADGTKYVTSAANFQNAFTGTLSVDVGFWIDTIPRATVPNWSGDFEAGVQKTINLPRASPSFTHEVNWIFGSQSGQLATAAATSVDWTPPLSLLEEIPNATQGNGLLGIITKSGSTVVGAKNYPFTLKAGVGIVPIVSAVTWDDDNPTVKTNVGAFVQGLSLVKGAVTAAGVYGSTITEKRLRIGTTPIPEGTAVQIAGSGTVTASGETVDSRARTGTLAANFTVLPYEPPKLGPNGWQIRRADSGGTPTDQGEYLRLDLNAIAASLNPGTEKNSLTIQVRTRPSGGSWTNRNTITPGLTYDTHVLISGGGVYPASSSFDVEVTLSDVTGIEPTRLMTTVPTATVTLDMDGTKVGVGKFWERGALDVGGDVHAGEYHSGNTPICPIGTVIEWYSDTIPDGWLLLNGQAVSRTTYADLFALWGTTHGAGDGSTTFNLVDRRGRAGVGKSTDTEFNTLGKKYGTKTHTLTTAEMPAHGHKQTYNPATFAAGGGSALAGMSTVAAGSAEAWNTTSNAGGGGSHNNIQPSIAANYIVRAI